MYALKIRKSDLALLTVLNGGVTPKVEKQTTYLLISIEDAENTTNKIVTERELYANHEFSAYNPLLLKLKK